MVETIGIIGNGVVGSATANAFRKHVREVRCWDIDGDRCTTPSILHTLTSDLIFVCLPTPQDRVSGSLRCKTGVVEAFFMTLAGANLRRNYVLRSTVPVGYTRKLRERYGLVNLVHSPEFLTARTADYDAANPVRNIIGDPTYTRIHDSEEMSSCAYRLKVLYDKAFLYEVSGELSAIIPDYIPPTYMMTSDESEAVKLFQNSFSAVKIAAFNEFRAFSDAKKLDWELCLAALLAGGWINPMHTQVPGPDGKFGFGGSCLPKDLANLVQCMDDAKLTPYMCRSALVRNEKVDRK